MRPFDNPWIIGIGVTVISAIIIWSITAVIKFGKEKLQTTRKGTANILRGEAIPVKEMDTFNNKTEVKVAQIDYRATTRKSSDLITPKSIYETISLTPLLQRESTAKNYEGIEISWKLNIINGGNRGRTTSLTMLDPEFKYVGITCEIDTSKYLELKFVKEGNPVTITGEIASVDASGGPIIVRLKNCDIVLH